MPIGFSLNGANLEKTSPLHWVNELSTFYLIFLSYSKIHQMVPMRKTFHIPDIHCSACVMHLEALEDEMPGILNIRGSYQKQRLDVEFDETRIMESQIRDAILELGYRPE
jgi:copper chaperone CopZ